MQLLLVFLDELYSNSKQRNKEEFPSSQERQQRKQRSVRGLVELSVSCKLRPTFFVELFIIRRNKMQPVSLLTATERKISEVLESIIFLFLFQSLLLKRNVLWKYLGPLWAHRVLQQ